MAEIVTWHHGLIASWWANFNVDGPEIEFFRPYVRAGQPALDAACGTGRLLVPWVADGFDVDGVDGSADMIAHCRHAAGRTGRDPALYVQPLHLLDIPRAYGSIICCGGFGLGATREQDLQGLRRMLVHLRPGGVLALDYEVGEFDAERARSWRPQPPDDAPPEPADRRVGSDRSEYALRDRILHIDIGASRVHRELRAWKWRDGELVAHERHELIVNVYTRTDILAALDEAGFTDACVVGGYHGGEPTGDERFLVYLASRPT